MDMVEVGGSFHQFTNCISCKMVTLALIVNLDYVLPTTRGGGNGGVRGNGDGGGMGRGDGGGQHHGNPSSHGQGCLLILISFCCVLNFCLSIGGYPLRREQATRNTGWAG